MRVKKNAPTQAQSEARVARELGSAPAARKLTLAGRDAMHKLHKIATQCCAGSAEWKLHVIHHRDTACSQVPGLGTAASRSFAIAKPSQSHEDPVAPGLRKRRPRKSPKKNRTRLLPRHPKMRPMLCHCGPMVTFSAASMAIDPAIFSLGSVH